MRITSKTAVQSILFLLKQHGVKDIVYSPGSRNAPFAIGLDGNPDFSVHIKVDERSAAFYALGIAQQTQKPVVLICTSGTAPLNYAPAIAEAFYQEIPLIVITADRPAESINQSEGQCIDQKGIYSNFIKRQSNLIEEAQTSDDVSSNHRMIDNAIATSYQYPKGPVHLNVPFYEPLYREADSLHDGTQVKVSRSLLNDCTIELNLDSAQKYLLLLGQNAEEEVVQEVAALAKLKNVWIFTETHSNAHALGAIDCIDRWIMSRTAAQLESLEWDVVISLGHNIISRKIKTLIKQKAKAHWSVQYGAAPINTYRLDPMVFQTSIAKFLRSFHSETARLGFENRGYEMDNLKSFDENEYFASRPFSDIKLFHLLSQVWPRHADIQMGNSSVVRYIQLFDQRRDLRFFGNRGVSGIDGSTSTAVGAAVYNPKEVVLVTGDLSFLYDANGLWHAPWPKNLKVIIVDNGGGGIFNIIDGAKNEPAIHRFFETPHQRNVLQWVQGWGFQAMEVSNVNSKDLAEFFNQSEISFLIVKTPSELNPIELDLFFEYYKQQNERMENN